jgi:hypothetical protein
MKTYKDEDFVFVDENGNEYISTPEPYFPMVELFSIAMLVPFLPVFVYLVYGWLYA